MSTIPRIKFFQFSAMLWDFSWELITQLVLALTNLKFFTALRRDFIQEYKFLCKTITYT